MRRQDKEITDQQVILDVIRQTTFCHLGLCDGTEPYVVPLCFGGDYPVLYLHSAREGRKMDLLQHPTRVCVTFVAHSELRTGPKPCAFSVSYASVMAWGTARVVTDPAEKVRGLDAIMTHYDQRPGDYGPALANTQVIRVDLDRITAKRSP